MIELNILKTNGLGGIIIVLIVLVIFLGWRVSVMTAIGIPFCYLGTVIVLDKSSPVRLAAVEDEHLAERSSRQSVIGLF